MLLEGAALAAAVAHESGRPVLVGGGGVTPYGLDRMLGADTAAHDLGDVCTALDLWAAAPPTVLAAAGLCDAPGVAVACAAGLDVAATEALGGDCTVEELRWALLARTAASLTGTAAVWHDFEWWFRAYFLARGRPSSVADRALDALLSVAGDHEPVLRLPAAWPTQA